MVDAETTSQTIGMRHPSLAALGLVLLGRSLAAQPVPAPPIQDNSFFLEEAYNQERNVIQTIQTFQRMRGSTDFVYTLTQEWPAPDQRHQLSFTLPLLRQDSATGVGDLAVNYRYQLVGDGDAPVAVSPRASVLVPIGNEERGLGTGSWGLQVNLPLSVALGTSFASHTNLGLSYLPRTRDDAGERSTTAVWGVGQGLVWLARPTFNVLVEAVWTRTEVRPENGAAASREDFLVSPGLRVALNLGKLQVVPGVAFPIGVGPSRGSRGVFLYLSFEHPLSRTPPGDRTVTASLP